MSRPIPTWPRGTRRRRPPLPVVLLGCPRVSPEWELSTLAALMRPTAARRGKVEHRGGGQDPWPAGTDDRARGCLAHVADRLGFDPEPWGVQAPPTGEYFLIAAAPAEQEPAARAAAVALSRVTPGQWWVVGRLFVRDGRFHRRRRGYRLELVEAADVHLPRGMRARLRGLV